MSKHIDILEVRAEFVRKGEEFYADEMQNQIVAPDGTFLDFYDAAEDVGPVPDEPERWRATRDVWLLELRACGDGLPAESMLESEADAVGWHDVLSKQGKDILADAAAVRDNRIDRARELRAPLLSAEERMPAVEALVEVEGREPVVFVAAVETEWRGDGEDSDSKSTYLGRIDCKRLREVLVRRTADA